MQLAEGSRAQRLGDAFAQFVAGQAAFDVVLLELGNDRLAIGVARAQLVGRPCAPRLVVHQI